MFDTTAPNKSTRIIEGESSGVLNWDDIRMPKIYKLYKVLLANYWIADEIPMNQDKTQWSTLTDAERDTFKRIIGLLAVLDSMQTNFVIDVGNYFTDSSLTAITAIINHQEVIHNQSYSYVLSSLVPMDEQKQVFEYWKHDPVLLERNLFIRDRYQRFREEQTPQTFFEAIVADMILEGIFFYAGFAFFYNLARNGKMLATSQMIQYIMRDEQQHCYFFGEVFKQLLIDIPELNTPTNIQYVYDTIDEAVRLEVAWAHHVLSDIAGINMDEFETYIRYIANRRLGMMGLDKAYPNAANVMPWIKPFTDEAMNRTKTDFFESKSRTYAKVSDDNGFDDL